MKEVDNFDRFTRDFKLGEFYFVQIIERHKDNPEKAGLNGGNSCRVLKSYSIASMEELIKRIPIIKEYCLKYQARCYIHPARRSHIDIAHEMIIMLGEFLKKSNHRLDRLYESACGTNKGVERLWIIDIDTKDFDVVCETKDRILEWGMKIEKEIKYYILPTVNGYHIVTTPFDVRILEGIDMHDIHKNNPTLLYCNLSYEI